MVKARGMCSERLLSQLLVKNTHLNVKEYTVEKLEKKVQYSSYSPFSVFSV
jgi:hypothetical protein